MINIIKLYQDFRIPFQTGGGRGVARGWVGISCPFCTGNPGHHLGYCIDSSSRFSGAFNCWRCGGKSAVKVVARITHSTESQARAIIKQYQSGSQSSVETDRKKRKKASKCVLPAGTVPLNKRAIKYLEKRNFDVDYLQEEWGLKSTGPVGAYKQRIIIPIYFKNQLVSYQGRDITGRSGAKYKACPQELEVVDHKNSLYGYDDVRGDSVITVEGASDVWRMRTGTVGTFGIKYTMEQIRLLCRFSRIFMLFDPDPEAKVQAELLGKYLTALGKECEIITLDQGDPADLTDDEAQYIVKDLLG